VLVAAVLVTLTLVIILDLDRRPRSHPSQRHAVDRCPTTRPSRADPDRRTQQPHHVRPLSGSRAGRPPHYFTGLAQRRRVARDRAGAAGYGSSRPSSRPRPTTSVRVEQPSFR
jgi:hypothetical protein